MIAQRKVRPGERERLDFSTSSTNPTKPPLINSKRLEGKELLIEAGSLETSNDDVDDELSSFDEYSNQTTAYFPLRRLAHRSFSSECVFTYRSRISARGLRGGMENISMSSHGNLQWKKKWIYSEQRLVAIETSLFFFRFNEAREHNIRVPVSGQSSPGDATSFSRTEGIASHFNLDRFAADLHIYRRTEENDNGHDRLTIRSDVSLPEQSSDNADPTTRKMAHTDE